MQLKCGQKIVVKSPFNDNFIGGRIVSFFYLTEDEASYLRKKRPLWAHVQAGDRAFHFDAPELKDDQKERDFNPRIFVLGYDEMYLCMR